MLDIPSVKLVWITPDAEKLCGKIARVSNPRNEDNPKVSKLLNHMVKEGHWSPFEMISMCVEIVTTRAISAQILRHGKGFSFQEFSQRYAEATQLVVPDLRRQDHKNRQNSIADIPKDLVDTYQQMITNHFENAMDLYHRLLEAGIARECARAVLPMNTATRMYMVGPIRSFLFYTKLRCGNGTQLEHQEIAFKIKDILFQQLPIISEVFFSDDDSLE